MAVETALKNVERALSRLRESFLVLRTTLSEDKPSRGDAYLVDVMDDALQDVSGWLTGARSSLREGRADAELSLDPPYLARQLSGAYELFHQVLKRYFTDLASFERLSSLAQLGQERGGEWRAWTQSVIESLEACRQPLIEANYAFVLCWQDLTECAGAGNVSVRATNIGQQLQLEDAPTPEGLT